MFEEQSLKRSYLSAHGIFVGCSSGGGRRRNWCCRYGRCYRRRWQSGLLWLFHFGRRRCRNCSGSCSNSSGRWRRRRRLLLLLDLLTHCPASGTLGLHHFQFLLVAYPRGDLGSVVALGLKTYGTFNFGTCFCHIFLLRIRIIRPTLPNLPHTVIRKHLIGRFNIPTQPCHLSYFAILFQLRKVHIGSVGHGVRIGIVPHRTRIVRALRFFGEGRFGYGEL
mmetsp:Transcript_41151/g.70431  ORF Transcript_41151/g.70431 Transcript_41151/m.70431 type:complete len:221 (-) Transcript_41151:676-1338(-)